MISTWSIAIAVLCVGLLYQARHIDVHVQFVQALATCNGFQYEPGTGAVCTSQGPYCPAYPVDGQQGRFFFPGTLGIGNQVSFYSQTVYESPLYCLETYSKIIPREELGFTKVAYSPNPQYTGGFSISNPSQVREASDAETFNLIDGTGLYAANFWQRTSAIRIVSKQYMVQIASSPGKRMPVWLTHLDINLGVSWSFYDLEYVSRTVYDVPYIDNFGQSVYSGFGTWYVRLPYMYGKPDGSSRYGDVPYADASLYVHNGNGPVPIPVGRTICQVDCGKLGPEYQCNLAGTKCECIPPLIPVLAADDVGIASCAKGQLTQFDWDWPLPQKAHRSNGAQTPYQPLDNARGMCFTDISGALLTNSTNEATGRTAWCREYGGLTFTERCSGRGWHLQYRNQRDHFPTILDMDCKCDSGWTGKRCHAPCWRLSSNDTCEAKPWNSCDRMGFKRSSISSAVCVPNHLLTITPEVTFFTTKSTNVYQIYRFNTQETQYFREPCNADPTCFRTTYVPPTCSFDAAMFRLPSSLSSLSARPLNKIWYAPDSNTDVICDRTYRRDDIGAYALSPYSYYRSRGFVPLKALVLDESNYPCDISGSPSADTQSRNSSTNPCAYGTNPIVNPLHLNEPSGYNTIRDAVNYNSAGIDRHIVLVLDDSINTMDQQDFHRTQGVTRYVFMAQTARTDIDTRNYNLFFVYLQGPMELRLSGYIPDGEAGSYQNYYDKYSDWDRYFGSGPDGNQYAYVAKNIVRCKGTNVIVAPDGVCQPIACRAGTAGQFCEIECNSCNPDQHCDEGRNGTGRCVCDDPLAYLNVNTQQCSTQGCGNDYNLCSGAGVCITSGIEPYCSCNAGFDGAICQIVRSSVAYNAIAEGTQLYDECDCSVLWRDYQLVDRSHPIPAGLAVLTDWSPPLAPLTSPVLYNGIVNVGGSDQARHMCHKDALCVGFAMHILTDYWRQTGQIDTGISVYRAIFFYQTNNLLGAVNGGIVFPTGIAVEYHSVSRYDGYACASSVLQVQPWYYNTYYTTVQPYCQQLLTAYALAYPEAQPVSQSACASNDMFISHWRYKGHLARLSPNPQCVLSPTLYSQESYCRGSRCPTNGNVPCSGVGVCQQTAPGVYQCACEKFSSTTSTGILGLNGNPRYLGNSCQFSVSNLCVQPQAATICSDNPSRCRPRLVFNSNFYNGNSLDVKNSTDYIPFCDCSGTNLQGTYCEQSRCGALSGGCKSLSASSGDCLLQNPATQEYACVCQQISIGKYCETDATSCLNKALQLKCSAQGDCLAADVNHAKPWCNCRNGAFGEFCENSDCPNDVMVPGHGQCVNRQLQYCYDVYQGVRCEIDRCALWDGVVKLNAQGLPSSCACQRDGWSNQYQNTTVPSCWPQCPVLNGQMCGVSDALPHGCNQNELAGSRYAQCVCAAGYIEVDHPFLTGVKVCEKYCKHGVTPGDWNPTNPTACICDASTGFDTLSNSPRCDHPICANDGIYNVAAKTCICQPPFSAFNKCTTNTCGAGNSVALWTDSFATSKYRCQCNNPYRSRFENAPFDCAGSACGVNGYLNPFYTTANSPANLCICTGKWKTNCTSLTNVCSYCSITACLNNGVALQSNPKLCVCPIPFVNGPLGLCEISACAGNNQTSSIVANRCVCTAGFQGPLCEESICLNQGIFNPASQRCTCPSTAAGYFCEVLLIDYLPQTPTTGITMPPSVSLGPMASSSSSSTGAAGGVVPPGPTKSSGVSQFSDLPMNFLWLGSGSYAWMHTLAIALAASLLILG